MVKKMPPPKKPKPIKSALLSSTAPQIAKPDKPGFLSRFKSRRPPTISGVTSPPNPLKVMRIADALDFVRLHPDEEFGWTEPLCFVRVPVKGEKQPILHLIDEDLAMSRLPSKQIIRHRLALAAKPHDVLFLCIVPSENLENGFNRTALLYCHEAQTLWVKVSSRKAEGHEEYGREIADDPEAFPPTNWGTHSVEEWCEITFRSASIFEPNHPGWLRLIGAKPDLR
jgi:hypothetical protein